MNRLTATNTMPETQNVTSTVKSIVLQFDAIGVKSPRAREVKDQRANDKQDYDDS